MGTGTLKEREGDIGGLVRPSLRILDGVVLEEEVEEEEGIVGDVGGDVNLPEEEGAGGEERGLGLVKEAERSFFVLDLPLVSLTLFIGNVSY